MTEPTINVTDKDVLAILGSAYVELILLRGKVALLQAENAKLSANQKKPRQPKRAPVNLEAVK